MTCISCIFFGFLMLVLCNASSLPTPPPNPVDKACDVTCAAVKDKLEFDENMYNRFKDWMTNNMTKYGESYDKMMVAVRNQLSYDLAFNLYKDNKNVVFSPLGADAVLEMILAASGGMSRLELSNLLNINYPFWDSSDYQKVIAIYEKSVKDYKYNFTIGNLAFFSDNFPSNAQYQAYLIQNFKAMVETVNFGTNGESIKQKINQYISAKTNGNVTEALKSALASSTISYFSNIMSFRGRWEEAFDSKLTFDGNFKDSQNRDKLVKMMSSVGSFFYYTKLDSKQLEILEIPYCANISLYVLMPYKNTTLSKDLFISGSTYLESALKTMQLVQADIKMPKLRLGYESDLKSPFQQMGIEVMFTEKSEWLGYGKGFCVGESKQWVYVEISEGSVSENIRRGTPPKGTPLPEVKFFVDRPFAFVIKDKQRDCNLFMGTINEVQTQ